MLIGVVSLNCDIIAGCTHMRGREVPILKISSRLLFLKKLLVIENIRDVLLVCKIAQQFSGKNDNIKYCYHWMEEDIRIKGRKRSSGFLRISTVAFLLFLTPAGLIF